MAGITHMTENTQILIDLALEEDIGAGDVTSRYFIPEDRVARAFVVVRAPGVLSGVGIAAKVFAAVDANRARKCNSGLTVSVSSASSGSAASGRVPIQRTKA